MRMKRKEKIIFVILMPTPYSATTFVVAYGYATYLALYYTHLALLCLLVVASQRNVY